MLLGISLIVGAYLAGSIPTGVWYSLYKHKVDVRTLGSYNSGATNVGRNFGFKAAIFVSAIDVLKGWLPVLLAKYLVPSQDGVIMAVAIACVVGHAYPLFAHFKGGKIVATSIGVLLGFHFWTGLGMVLLFAALLYVTSTVSLSSMMSYSITAIYLLATHPQRVYGIGFLVIALLLLYRHKQNIVRLLNHEEKTIKFGLRQPKSQ